MLPLSCSILLFAFHVVIKLSNGLFHNIGKIHALIVLLFIWIEEVELEQFTHFLNPLGGLDHQHRQEQIHEALRNLLVSEQLAGVRMEFEKIAVSRLDHQETKVWISVHGGEEWWRSECKYKEQDAEREDVSRLRLARHLSGLVDLGSHVDRRAHLLSHEAIEWLRETEVTEFE